MTEGAATRRQVHAPPLFGIGQVLAKLQPEFPELTPSKLRFLEEQGLVRPERTAGGYRMYTAEHVRALRHVLQMQRDEFLPLRVIRDELKRRIAAGPSAAATKAAATKRRVSLAGAEEYMEAEELCRRAGVPASFLTECRQHDLVTGIRTEDGVELYSADECAVVRASAQMAALGIDVRHLRQVRSAIGRQAALVEQFAAARLRTRNAEQRASAVKAVESLTDLLGEFMHHAFVRDVRTMTSRTTGGVGGQSPIIHT